MEKPDLKTVNLAISGWSGAGSSTLALILARLLEKEYLYLGSLFRSLGAELGFADEGADRPRADDYLETHIGKILDLYADHMLLNEQGILVESDLSAFRIGRRESVFSAFLTCSLDVRLLRVENDGRSDARNTLLLRDSGLREKYKELWGIDVFDLKTIEEKYTVVLDVTELSIAEEAHIVLDELCAFTAVDISERIQLHVKIDQLVAEYFSLGRQAWREELFSKGLIRKPDQMKSDIVNLFSDDLAKVPEDIRRLFIA